MRPDPLLLLIALEDGAWAQSDVYLFCFEIAQVGKGSMRDSTMATLPQPTSNKEPCHALFLVVWEFSRCSLTIEVLPT